MCIRDRYTYGAHYGKGGKVAGVQRALGGDRPGGLAAVSYTHLDVYKRQMFNFEFGAVNSFLRSVGLAPVDVYSNKNAWPVILIVVSAFKNVGYGTVMYLASIVNIDGQLFEAADLDGATMWQKIWHITLPCIRPTIAILFLMAIGTDVYKRQPLHRDKAQAVFRPAFPVPSKASARQRPRRGLCA